MSNSPVTSRPTATGLVAKYASVIIGKVILTTGVSPNSLVAHFVTSLAAAKPVLLIMAGRDESKVGKTAEAVSAANPEVAVRTLRLDLGSLSAVRAAAAVVND